MTGGGWLESGRAEQRAIAEGAGGADHRQREHGGDGHDAHAPVRRRGIVVEVRRPRPRAGRCSDDTGPARSRRHRAAGWPGVSAVGRDRDRRTAGDGCARRRAMRRRFRRRRLRGRRGRGAEIVAGAEARRRRRRRRRRRSAARVIAAEFGERVGLSDQAGKFGERIAAGSGVAAGARARQRFIRTIGSSGSGRPPFGPRLLSAPSPALNREPASTRGSLNEIYRISSGASTPSNAKPEARTVTIPCTKASRAIVVSGSFWIMKRK